MFKPVSPKQDLIDDVACSLTSHLLFSCQLSHVIYFIFKVVFLFAQFPVCFFQFNKICQIPFNTLIAVKEKELPVIEQINIYLSIVQCLFINSSMYSVLCGSPVFGINDQYELPDQQELAGGTKKVHAFDLVQQKNYKGYIAQINVAVSIKA